MAIPVKREQYLVGRDAEIKQATSALLSGNHATVLLYGPPGVGKDVVAVEVVVDDLVGNHSALQLRAWLQGSTDTGLRRQLCEIVMTHRPKVIRGLEHDQPAALTTIMTWPILHGDEWLFVIEDATINSSALWECFPQGIGRLLATSQAPLHKLDENAVTSKRLEGESNQNGIRKLMTTGAIEFLPLKTIQCTEMWRKMNLFAIKKIPDGTDEDRIELQCRATKGAVQCTAPPTAGENTSARPCGP